jgi:hypothetical protein
MSMRNRGSVLLSGPNGGHNDYSGNEVDALALGVDTPRWVNLRPSSAPSAVISGTDVGRFGLAVYADGRPSSAHTYWAHGYLQRQDRMILTPTTGYTQSSNPTPSTPAGFDYLGTNYMHSFRYQDREWDLYSSYGARYPGPLGSEIASLVAQHPLTEDLYYSRGYYADFWRWDSTANSWAASSNGGGPRYAWYAAAAIDPLRSRLLWVGGEFNPGGLDLLTGTQQTLSFGGLGLSALTAVTNYPGMVYVPDIDAYLVLYNSSAPATTLLRIDASTLNVSAAVTTGVPPAPRPNGTNGSLKYAPELRAVAIANSYTGNVQFMRVAP